MITLRPYQQRIVDATLAGFNEYGKQLIVVPTGGGKTLIFSNLAAALQPRRTLILAHREELIDQAIEKLQRSTGIFADKEKAEFRASLQAQVVVGSVQTLQGARLQRWPQDHFGLVVVDEAHHCIAESYQRVLKHFDSHAWTLGVTATPDRGDKRNLGSYFENIAAEVNLFDLINDGFLSRIAIQSVPVEVDLKNVRTTAGDFNESDLGEAIEPHLRAVARAIAEHATFRRTLVFLPLCATSRTFVDICNEEGLRAAHIDGNSPDRKEILAEFAAGQYDVLSNAMLLTEGFDDPGIDCVVILRPTKSRALYSQMVGRGTRIAPGKSNLLLLDLLWLSERLNLIRPAHLIATSAEQADMITKIAEEKAKGGEQQILDLEGLASEAQIQREKKLSEELKAKAKRSARFVDAMEFCLSLHATDVAEWEDVSGWHRSEVSEPQRKLLEKNGIDPDSIKSRGHASAVIDLIINRREMGLCTPKQMKLLKRFAYKSPETATFEEASRFLDMKFSSKSLTSV